MNIKCNKKWLRLIGLAIAAFLVVNLLAIAWLFVYPELKTRTQFAVLPSPLTHTYDLFDLGVVDANNDSYLDIFTLNHSARQDFLLNNGDGTYEDGLSDWNLDQDHQFPSLEDSDIAPTLDAPGFYIYRQNFLLHLLTYKVNFAVPISGKFSLSLPVTIESQKGADIDIQENLLPSGTTVTSVSFILRDNAHVVIKDFPEILHKFELKEDIPLSMIHVGMQKLQPPQHGFTLMWRDRHSMAWSDVNNDGQKDVFIGRGGVAGKISQIPETLSDELFIQEQETFAEQINQFGVKKNDCPGRKSAWVDYDRDNQLDLYQSCGRSSEDPVTYPNQLYRREPNNSFVNVAETVGLDLPGAGYFQWLDADSDGNQDLIISQGKQLFVYKNQASHFEPQIIQETSGGTLIKLTIADFDQDGDLDAYSLVKGGKNQVLINQDGTFSAKDAAAYGLPEDGLEATWVDYDNDGLIDLHVVPNGIYRQVESRKFTETHVLDFRRPLFSIWNARSVWFDADNDGDRDLILTYQQIPSILQSKPSLPERIKNQVFKRDTSRIWQSVLYENRSSQSHWLEANLIGSLGNTEAIGTVISVETDGGIQTHQIGMTEGAHYSQGDYRAYFGLGNRSKVKRMFVQWTDGSKQEFNEVSVDQQLTIKKD